MLFRSELQSSVSFAPANDTALNSFVTIAYVIHSMRVGGAERSIARLINALDRERFRPLVICVSKSGPAAAWIDDPNVPVIELSKRGGFFDRQAICRMAELLTANRVDIVHSHNWGSLVESMLACRRARTPVHIHAERGSVLGRAEMRGWKMRLRGQVAGRVLRRCDAVVTNAHSVAQRVEDRCGYPADRVRVVPNGVEVPRNQLSQEQVQHKRRQMGIEDTAVLLGSVGRLVPVKGFELAVESLARVQACGGNHHLMLVGDGPERASLERLAADHGVADRLHCIGHQGDVGPWLSLFDVYLNTSYSEGMSQSLVEAMSVGLPVIVSDVGDSARVVGQSRPGGIVVAAGDVDGLTQSILVMVDPQRRCEFGEAARQRHLQAFTPERMAECYESVYRECLGKVFRQSTASSGGGISC